MKRFLSVFTALVLALLSVSLLPRLPETPFLPAAAIFSHYNHIPLCSDPVALAFRR